MHTAKIKFGTDGWRAIIAKDFTVENVTRVAEATALWLTKNFKKPGCVVGHDCRFGGELFAETVAKVLASRGIRVYLAKGFISTPMVSLGALKHNASLGVVITASHNPPSYNGYKLKGGYGGPLVPDKVQEVEDLIPDQASVDTESLNITEFVNANLIKYVDLEKEYIRHVKKNFDIKAIKSSGLKFGYDAMFGAGQNVIKKLFGKKPLLLHCENNPSFNGQAPEPIHRNLLEFSEKIAKKGNIACGLATDGDADRIGLYDSKGNFVDSHHIILLLIKYLCEEKKMKGKVVTAFSVTPRVKKLCDHFKLENQVVKIGFKHIAGIMISEDVLLGGEESGGIAIKGHIPERDGLWMGFVIWEYMAKSGKTLEQLIEEVYKITGPFAFERVDLHLDEATKNRAVEACREGKLSSFGKYKVERHEEIDGWKYYFDDGKWLMIRASGTEPVLRTYAEAATKEEAFEILKEAERTIHF